MITKEAETKESQEPRCSFCRAQLSPDEEGGQWGLLKSRFDEGEETGDLICKSCQMDDCLPFECTSTLCIDWAWEYRFG